MRGSAEAVAEARAHDAALTRAAAEEPRRFDAFAALVTHEAEDFDGATGRFGSGGDRGKQEQCGEHRGMDVFLHGLRQS